MTQPASRPATAIDPPGWMTSAAAGAVMAALAGEGGAPGALFVGGCVRNALLGEAVKDIDIATIHAPEEAVARLAAAGIRTIPTGIDHGTVTALAGGGTYEITTLRRDVLTDGRRAVVAYTDDWAEDAARRDFTLNALYADSAGHVFDPTGQGLADLLARRVVFVGDPARRIEEDYLRVLRFFRFTARYGGGHIDPAGLAACRAAADELAHLSRERVSQEFGKILSVDRPVDILLVMFENKVLADLPHPEWQPELLEALSRAQKKAGMHDLIARYAVLAALDASYMARFERRLIFSNKEKKMFAGVIEGLGRLEDSPHAPEPALKRLIFSEGQPCAAQALLLFMSRHSGLNAARLLSLARDWVPPEFPISGEDVAAAGISPGPQTGALLARVREWWMLEDFLPGREACLRKLEQVVRD
jgi:poly(A) polymerase